MDPKRMVVLIDGSASAQSSAGNSDNEDVRMTASASQLSPSQIPLATSNSGLSTSKDSRWLTLEVCREFQRGKCTRSEEECKFAHPPPYVEVNNGKVVACFDNLKGRCQRVSPPCKYLHPPQHLKDILQQNGRNNLILRSLAMAGNVQLSGAATTPTPLLAANGAAMGGGTAFLATTSLGGHAIAAGTAAPANSGQAAFLHSLTPGTAPVQFAYAAAPTALAAMIAGQNASPLTAAHAGPTFLAINPTYATAGIPVNFRSPHSQPLFEPAGFHTAFFQNQAAGTPATFIPSYVTVRPPQTTAIRTDRLEVCKDFQQGICPFSGTSCQFAHPPAHCPVDRDGLVTVCVDYVKGKCTRDSCKYFHPPDHLVAQLKALSSHHQSNNVCGTGGHYPAVFCSAFNPAVSAVASQRLVTAMMLAGGSTAPSLHHSTALPTNAGLLSTGGLLVAQGGSPSAPPTAFFPGATHILTGTGPSLQARPTIIASNPTQQFIGALTYLPSKRQAIDEIVSSAAKRRTYEEANMPLQHQQQLQPNQIGGMLHCYQPASASSNCVVSSASVQTVIPQAIVDTNESQDYDLAQQLPSVEQYTQTATSNSAGQAQCVGMTTSALVGYTTGIE